MSIRPLDLQTNFSQMHEVGRLEHARNASVLAQQALLDDQAIKQADLKKERLDELEKSDQSNYRDVLSENEDNSRNDEHETEHKAADDVFQDEDKPKDDPDKRYGRFLDVLR